MTSSSGRKGNRGELEAAAILSDLLGFKVRRKLGAGRLDDTGDLDGIPDTVIQVANWKDTAAAVRSKPVSAEQQRVNAGATFVATMVRFPGGTWRVVMTPEQYSCYVRESLA